MLSSAFPPPSEHMDAEHKPEDDLPEALRGLHDAVLTNLEIAPSIRVCEFRFRGAPFTGNGRPFVIRFKGVRSVVVPVNHPWGSSSSVLDVQPVNSNGYVFIMQSGDEISVFSTEKPARSVGDA